MRAIVFALVMGVVAWTQMAFNANTGNGVHHTILLWPLPQVITAVCFAEASRRLGRAGVPLVAAATAVLMGSGLLLMNTYYTRLARNGGAISWTDAIFPLTSYLKAAPARAVYCLDWGFLDSVRMLSDNQVPVRVGEDPINKPGLTEADRQQLLDMISHGEDIFVTHSPGFEFYPGLSAKLVRFAESAGYRRKELAVIADSNGRPTFEVFRFAGATPGFSASSRR